MPRNGQNAIETTGDRAGQVALLTTGDRAGQSALALEPAVTITGSDYIIFAGGDDSFNNDTGTTQYYDIINDEWTLTEYEMPTKRVEAGGAALDGYLYVVAGAKFDTSSVLNDVERFDVANGNWESVSNYPISVRFNRVEVIDGELFSFGGMAWDEGTQTGESYKYNPDTDTWTQIASIPSPRARQASFVIDGIVYLCGGEDSSSSIQSDVWAYDPADDSYTKKADMPSYDAPSGSDPSGHRDVPGNGWVFVDFNAFKYDPDTDSWTTGAGSDAIPESTGRTVVLDSEDLLTGTESGLGNVYRYDPDTETSSQYGQSPDGRGFPTGAGFNTIPPALYSGTVNIGPLSILKDERTENFVLIQDGEDLYAYSEDLSTQHYSVSTLGNADIKSNIDFYGDDKILSPKGRHDVSDGSLDFQWAGGNLSGDVGRLMYDGTNERVYALIFPDDRITAFDPTDGTELAWGDSLLYDFATPGWIAANENVVAWDDNDTIQTYDISDGSSIASRTFYFRDANVWAGTDYLYAAEYTSGGDFISYKLDDSLNTVDSITHDTDSQVGANGHAIIGNNATGKVYLFLDQHGTDDALVIRIDMNSMTEDYFNLNTDMNNYNSAQFASDDTLITDAYHGDQSIVTVEASSGDAIASYNYSPTDITAGFAYDMFETFILDGHGVLFGNDHDGGFKRLTSPTDTTPHEFTGGGLPANYQTRIHRR